MRLKTFKFSLTGNFHAIVLDQVCPHGAMPFSAGGLLLESCGLNSSGMHVRPYCADTQAEGSVSCEAICGFVRRSDKFEV